MGRLLDSDPITQTESIFHWDELAGGWVIENRQDVTEIVETSKAIANADDGNWKGDMHRVASIPLSVYEQLRKDGIADDEKRLKRWLNDPDNRVFRTKLGTV